MGLVVVVGVEGEVSEEFTGLGGDDSDVEIFDDEYDWGVGVSASDADVV